MAKAKRYSNILILEVFIFYLFSIKINVRSCGIWLSITVALLSIPKYIQEIDALARGTLLSTRKLCSHATFSKVYTKEFGVSITFEFQ
jgi:hypothetical protein